MALAAADLASPTEAASSGLSSVASRSPRWTWSPGLTATLARRPVASGAMRISVWRTMPGSKGGCWLSWPGAPDGRRTEIAAIAQAIMTDRLFALAGMRCPPHCDDPRRDDRQQREDAGQHPQAHPVVRHVG